MSIRSDWRHKASATHKRPSAPGASQAPTRLQAPHRLAEPGHRRAVHAEFMHYLIASA